MKNTRPVSILLSALVLVAACADPRVAACIEGNSVSAGGTYTIDSSFLGDEDNLAQVESECGCEIESLITAEAALCIAEAAGFEHGIEGWRLNLVYKHDSRRVAWDVYSVTDRPSEYEVNGVVLSIDATIGTIIGQQNWDMIS